MHTDGDEAPNTSRLHPPGPTSLPDLSQELVPPRFREETLLRRAYQACLSLQEAAENEAAQHVRNEKKLKDKLVSARTLGYLLLNAPTEQALLVLAREIQSCDDLTQVEELGAFYIYFLIRLFKGGKGRLRQKFPKLPRRRSFEMDKSAQDAVVEEAPARCSKAIKKTYKRDNNRCVVTGAVKHGLTSSASNTVSGRTQCAHIVPDSTFFGMRDHHKRDWTTSVLAVLHRFGYDVQSFNGAKVHNLLNLMVLHVDVHLSFDGLCIWFEETTATPNEYFVSALESSTLPMFKLPRTITLSSPDQVELPLPSPYLLGLHAACCKVANLSGAGELLEAEPRSEGDGGVGTLSIDTNMLTQVHKPKRSLEVATATAAATA